jgi:hypothetical protein
MSHKLYNTVVEIKSSSATYLFYCNRIPFKDAELELGQIKSVVDGCQSQALMTLIGDEKIRLIESIHHLTPKQKKNLILDRRKASNVFFVSDFPPNTQIQDDNSHINYLKYALAFNKSLPHEKPQPSQPHPQHQFTIDATTAQCLYIQTGPTTFAKLGAGVHDSNQLLCLTCNGMIPASQMTQSDFSITKHGTHTTFELNPSKIIRLAFKLNRASSDRTKKVVMTFPPVPGVNVDFNLEVPVSDDGNSPLICFYEPYGVERFRWTATMQYHTDLMNAPLAVQQNIVIHQVQVNPPDYLIEINPAEITMEFLKTLENVHVYGNLGLPHCPLEKVVAARFKTPLALSEPICLMFDHLSQNPENVLFRLPYLYTVNVSSITCTKRKIDYHAIARVKNELRLTYLDDKRYAELITPHIESLLMGNVLFQMMFTYGKFGTQFMECPEHSMVIDFYVRRDSGQVGFHYDLTEMFQVSSFSLLYSMPPGVIRPGPMFSPVPFGHRPLMAPMRPDVTTFAVGRGICVLVNNVAGTHSTPCMNSLFERGCKLHTLEPLGKNLFEFNFPEMWIPEEFQEEMRATKETPRSFLRMWHVVNFESAMPHLSQPEFMFDQEVFGRMISETIVMQQKWLAEEPCACIDVGNQLGPTTISAAAAARRVKGMLGGRQSQSTTLDAASNFHKSHTASNLHIKSKSSTASLNRASTMSSIREKIKSKLKQIKHICADAHKNVVVVAGGMKSKGGKRKSTNTTRRRPRVRKTRMA